MNYRSYEELYLKSFQLKERFLEVFANLGFGHLTTALSETEILMTLYYGIMSYKKDDPNWEERDRFVLSKGHGAGMLFPIYEDLGMLQDEKLEDIVKLGGDNEVLKKFFYPGFEFYGGSLGIGLGVAAGLAKAAMLSREPWFTYCLVGDAETYEGSCWEAAMFAGANHLNNLVVIVDRNGLGCSDFTENMLPLEPYAMKWESRGFCVKEINGHCFEELIPAFGDLKTRPSNKPTCIIAHTVKGNGVKNIENRPLMHGYMPKNEDAKRISEQSRKLNRHLREMGTQ